MGSSNLLTAPIGALALVALSCFSLGSMTALSQENRSILPASAQNGKNPIVFNGDFREWSEGRLAGWQTDIGTEIVPDAEMAYASPGSVRITRVASTPQKAASLIYQDVVLKPDTEYLLKGWVAKSASGTVIVRVQPSANGRLLTGQESALDEAAFSAIMPWFPIEYRFRTGKHAGYRLSILDFSRLDAPAWFSDIALVPLDEEAGDDRRESHVAFSGSIMHEFDERRRPKAGEVLQRLVAFGTKGEYAPVLLGLHAFRELSGVDVRVKGDLAAANGAGSIPAAAVEIRMVAEQALLPVTRPRPVSPGRNAGWWVTVKIPESAPAGSYRGELEIVSAEGVLAQVPYEVNVEQFTLPEPKASFAAYHAEAYIPPGFLTAPLREAYYRDMREHGMNTATVYSTPDVDGKNVDFSRELRMSAIKGEARQKELKKNRWSEEEVEDRASWGLDRIFPLMLESGLVRKERPVLWLPLKLAGYTFGDMGSEALQNSLKEWRTREEWPEPLLYVIDEPAEIPERIEHARRALKRIEGLDLNVRTVTANVDIEELGDSYNVWIMGADRITQDLFNKAQVDHKEIWAYACNIPADNSQFSRAMFGFWAYRTGIHGVAIWAYYDARTWYADEQGTVHGKNGRANLARVCVSPQGPIPTTSWEATREGVTDYRYAQLFDQLIAEAHGRIEALRQDGGAVLSDAARKSLQEGAGDWQPNGAEEEKAAAAYRKALELEQQLEPVLGWRNKLINSIPYDAMAPLKDTPASTRGRWVPALGVGDPELVSAHKRASIRAYIRYLSGILERTK